ncbi:MAG: hypothetical protein UEP57_08095 [Oscillospiraceae bacterium]|nr:hypothetical protein [Oscillospiraceae bacterium]
MMHEAWENAREAALFVVEMPFLVVAAIAAVVLHTMIFVVDMIEAALNPED